MVERSRDGSIFDQQRFPQLQLPTHLAEACPCPFIQTPLNSFKLIMSHQAINQEGVTSIFEKIQHLDVAVRTAVQDGDIVEKMPGLTPAIVSNNNPCLTESLTTQNC